MNIRPCPFCGEKINPESEESWYFFGEGPPPGYTVRCDSCGAQGPYGYGKFRKDHAGGQANAVERWNEAPRFVPVSTQETPADEVGECPTCRAGTGANGRRVHLSLCPATNRRESL